MKGARNRSQRALEWALPLLVAPLGLLEAIALGWEALPLPIYHQFGPGLFAALTLGLLLRALAPRELGRGLGLPVTAAVGLACTIASGFHEDRLGWLRLGLHLASGAALLGGVQLLAARARPRSGAAAFDKHVLPVSADGKPGRKLDASEVVAGQRVQLISGSRLVPVDGEIMEGDARVEFDPLFAGAEAKTRSVGDVVLAGTRVEGSIQLEVKASTKHSFAVRMNRNTSGLIESIGEVESSRRLLHGAITALMLSGFAFGVSLMPELDWRTRASLLGNAGLIASLAPALLAVAKARARVIELLRSRGVYPGRLADLGTLLGARRVAIAPELVAAPGEVEVASFSDDSADEILVVAAALLADDEGPIAETLAAERERRGRGPARSAALRRTQAVFHGTVGGARWFLGPALALEEEEKQKLEGPAKARFEALSAKFPIVLLVGRPDRGLRGIVGLDLGRAPGVAALGRSLGATLLPGQPDVVREAISRSSGVSAKARPMKGRDLAILRFRDLPPSAGLSLRVAEVSDLVSHQPSDLSIVAAPALGQLAETLRDAKRIRKSGWARAGVLLLFAFASAALMLFWPSFPPLFATALGLSLLAFAAWL